MWLRLNKPKGFVLAQPLLVTSETYAAFVILKSTYQTYNIQEQTDEDEEMRQKKHLLTLSGQMLIEWWIHV